MASLAGKRALVTGGGQGVGRGIALALAEEGAAIALLGRTESKLQAVAHQIRDMGRTAITVVGDVTKAEDITRAVGEVTSELGGLDILVNNAQIPVHGTLLSASDEGYVSAWESGPLAVFRMMRAVRPHLGAGSVIINLGSSTSVNPLPIGRGVYASAKAAIASLTRVAATEWGSDGIRAITVMPAATSPASEQWADANPDEYQRSLQSIPLRRLGDPVEDIGRAVAMLCTPTAQFITGTTVALDGGQAYLR